MLKNWFRRGDKGDDVAHALYLIAVAQARQPLFYAEHGVPDSVDGRFDLIVMHVFLLLRPLSKLAEQDGDVELQARAGNISQALFDTMFGDMDRSLREMGVSDIAVGKRVKHMAKAFYGRVAAYDEGLAGRAIGRGLAAQSVWYGHADGGQCRRHGRLFALSGRADGRGSRCPSDNR